jgi:hypothetical protein
MSHKRQAKAWERFEIIISVLSVCLIFMGVFLAKSTSQAGTDAQATSQCLTYDASCSTLQIAVSPIRFTLKRSPKTAPTTSIRSVELAASTQSTDCQNIASMVTSYQSGLSNALNQTNQTIDTLRQAAMNSGEPYQAFDTAVNADLASYNSKVTTAYTTLLQTTHDCQVQIPNPIYFNSFTP